MTTASVAAFIFADLEPRFQLYHVQFTPVTCVPLHWRAAGADFIQKLFNSDVSIAGRGMGNLGGS